MTLFRQGSITRLWWAYRYLEFLSKQTTRLQERIARLERENKALGETLKASERDLQKALASLKELGVDAYSKGKA